MELSRKGVPILKVLYGLMGRYDKRYCFPTQDKLCELCSKFAYLSLSRRQLNYDLRAMERGGLIVRTRRHKRDPLRGMVFRSTLYHIGALGYHLLARYGIISWATLRQIVSGADSKNKARKSPCAMSVPGGDFVSVCGSLGGLLHVFV